MAVRKYVELLFINYKIQQAPIENDAKSIQSQQPYSGQKVLTRYINSFAIIVMYIAQYFFFSFFIPPSPEWGLSVHSIDE